MVSRQPQSNADIPDGTGNCGRSCNRRHGCRPKDTSGALSKDGCELGNPTKRRCTLPRPGDQDNCATTGGAANDATVRISKTGHGERVPQQKPAGSKVECCPECDGTANDDQREAGPAKPSSCQSTEEEAPRETVRGSGCAEL